VRDDQGRLSLAVRDTDSTLLSGTALPASFITSEMDRSRSRRQILVLDCCHSGAFAQGAKGDAGLSVGTASAFEGNGFGRVVLTATDATQYAWEGDRVIGDAQNSVFTRYLVEGLRTGEADRSGNGAITVDELYDYVYEQVLKATPKQVPGKWSYRQQGDLVLARSRRPMRPADLPGELQQAIASPFSSVRGAAVQELARLLQSSSPGMALAARMALRKLSEDDSRKVASDAAQALAGAPPEPAPAPAAEVRPTATPIVVPVAVPGDAPPIESAAGVDLSALDGLTRAGAGSRSIETGNLAASMSYTPPTTASGPAATGISRTTTAISAGSIPVIAPRSNRPLLLTLLGGGGIVLGMVLCCAAVFAVNTLLPSTSTPRATTAVAAATNALAVVATATARPTAATLSTPVSIAAATSTPRVAPSPTAPPVADVAPDFTLLDGLGNSVRLSTVARQHRSVAVVFYHGYT